MYFHFKKIRGGKRLISKVSSTCSESTVVISWSVCKCHNNPNTDLVVWPIPNISKTLCIVFFKLNIGDVKLSRSNVSLSMVYVWQIIINCISLGMK